MQRLYYYTSTDTMSKVLQNGNIWATNLEYMNDSREYLNGIQEIRDLVMSPVTEGWFKSKQKTEEFKNFSAEEIFSERNMQEKADMSSKYTISFCRHKDLLSQWTTYAKESGVCLEMVFDRSKGGEYLLYGRDQKEQEDRSIEVKKNLRDIYYFTKERGDQQKYQETAQRILEDLFGENAENLDGDRLVEKWEEISVYVKQYDFYQEEEVRLAFDTMKINSETGKRPKIGYRMDKHVLKPYMDIKSKDGWPVVSVMVGPGYNQDVVFKSIKFFLDHEEVLSSALITAEQWKEQIRNYLCSCRSICSLWKTLESGKSCGNSAVALLYKHWQAFSIKHKDDMLADIAEVIKQTRNSTYFDNCYFTKSGIVVERSSIPYIY